MNFYNYIKKIYYKFKFYKIKRKLKKILKVDMKFEKQFFYSVHIIKPRPKIKRKKNNFKNKPFKLLALFFGFKKTRSFKFLLKRKILKKYLISSKFNDFLYFLESRLETFLLRINFFNSIYFIKQFIYSKNIFINNMIICRPDFQLNIFDIININYRFFF
jgi:ribosomal protein S4